MFDMQTIPTVTPLTAAWSMATRYQKSPHYSAFPMML